MTTANIDLGKIRFKWQGTWNPATPYTRDDCVQYQGQAFVCVVDTGATSVFVTPAVGSTDWELMAAGGDPTTTMTTPGDLLVRGAGGLERLPVGADGTALRVSNGAPAWQTADYEILNRVRYVYTGGAWTTNGTSWEWIPGLYYDYTPVSSNSVIRAIAGWTAHRAGTYDIISHMEWARSNSDGSSITYLDSFPMADHSATYMSIWHTYQQELPSWGAGTTQRLGLRVRSADYTNYRAVFHETYWNYSPGNGRGSAAYPYWIVEEWSN